MTGAVAVIGSGAIGGMIAAALVEGGRDVTVCARTPFGNLEIERAGETRSHPVRVATDPGEVGPARWVLLTTKAQDTAGTAAWLEALAGPETTLAVIQNGVDQEERARPIAGPARILPAIVYCSAERLRPGRIRHHGMARLQVPQGSDGAAFAELFGPTLFEVVQEADFVTAAWRKLLGNAVANPITALTLRRTTVMREPLVQALARAVMAETVAVARAEGAKLSDADGELIVSGLGAPGSTGGSSMLYDRLAGRELEHAALTGTVVAAADRHGIAVPVNRTLLALLAGASGHGLDGAA